MKPFLLKAILSAIMFSVTSLAGIAAIMLRRKLNRWAEVENRRIEWILTLLSCFAGGVFMGTCFLDIFPHINEHYAHFRKEANWSTEFPLPEFIVCCGFFLVYLLEELILKVFAPTEKRKKCRTISRIGNNDGKDSSLSICSKPDCVMNSIKNHNEIDIQQVTQTLRHCNSCLDMLTHEVVIDKYLNEDSKTTDLLKSLTFAFAISFHSVLEGFALGVQDNSAGILTLFISLIIHKSIEAFSVGLQINKSGNNSLIIVGSLILAYALMTPIGSITGDFITNLEIAELPKEGIIIGLESLAAGTFIYVTFLEVLAQERANDHSNLLQLAAIFIGFLVINIIQIYELTTHSHSHGITHSNNEEHEH